MACKYDLWALCEVGWEWVMGAVLLAGREIWASDTREWAGAKGAGVRAAGARALLAALARREENFRKEDGMGSGARVE